MAGAEPLGPCALISAADGGVVVDAGAVGAAAPPPAGAAGAAGAAAPPPAGAAAPAGSSSPTSTLVPFPTLPM